MVNTQNEYNTALVLSCAVDLIAAATNKVIGNDASTSINGERLTDTLIETIAANRILKTVENKK